MDTTISRKLLRRLPVYLNYIKSLPEETENISATRMAAALEIPGATAELALDRGVLLGGGQELPFAEVEVELKAGSEAAVTAFADDLARRFRLEPEPKSKQQRALALAKGNVEHGQS